MASAYQLRLTVIFTSLIDWQRFKLIYTNKCIPSHTPTQMEIHTHSVYRSLSLSCTHTHTLTHSVYLSLTHTHTYTLTLSVSPSHTHTHKQCWETRVGQEMYRLALFDFLTTIAVLILVEFPRRSVQFNNLIR